MQLIQKISGYFVNKSGPILAEPIPADQKAQGAFASFLSKGMGSSSKKFHFAIAGVLVLTLGAAIYMLWNKRKKPTFDLSGPPLVGLRQLIASDMSVAEAKAVLLNIIRKNSSEKGTLDNSAQQSVIKEMLKLAISKLIHLNECILQLLPKVKKQPFPGPEAIVQHDLLSTLLQQAIRMKSESGSNIQNQEFLQTPRDTIEEVVFQVQPGELPGFLQTIALNDLHHLNRKLLQSGYAQDHDIVLSIVQEISRRQI